MKPIKNMKVSVYLEELAEVSFPGPASGSAAATIAGMAAALLEMSYKVTLKKSGAEMRIDLDELTKVREQCLELATEDVEALDGIIRAARLRKESPEQYETAVQKATIPLVALVKILDWIMRQIEQLLPVCDIRVYAELMGSAHMAEAALESAKLGIEANLHLTQDGVYKQNMKNLVQNVYPINFKRL